MKKKTVLILRTTDKDNKSYGGFQWPELGPVECPDWNPKPQCGNGLHGWLWGAGNWGLKTQGEGIKWKVVEVLASDVVDIDGSKVKFPKGNVIGSFSTWTDAMAVIRARALKSAEIVAVATKKKEIASATGYSGHASATGYYGWAIAGYHGKAKADKNGVITLLWWDEKAERPRVAVGYVGEDGIKADTWYSVIDGKLKAN